MVVLEADKGYDCQWLKTFLLARGIFPLIPRRKVGKPSPDRPALRQVCDFFKITSTRWKIERTFSWLKRKCRRLMVSWERRLNTWLGMIKLSLVNYWIEILVR
jgi:transposase